MDFSGIWQELLVLVVVPLIGILGALLGKWLVQLIKNSKTKYDDYIAAVAVKWVEDLMGGSNGAAKLRRAAEKLQELSAGKLSYEQAELMVRAAYQSTYGELAKLKNA